MTTFFATSKRAFKAPSAALAVNRELVLLYWQIGRDILERQAKQGWGAAGQSRFWIGGCYGIC
jgi:hypothetical protein